MTDVIDKKTDACGTRRAPVGKTETRFSDVAPASYDKKARTVECVISVGSPVKRFYGTEMLRINADAVKLDRMKTSGIPLLDSHQQVGLSNHLGRFVDTWITSGAKPALMGRIVFDDTPEGRKAEGMIARSEIAGISAGYRVDNWLIEDGEGRVIDPEVDRIRWDDDSLTFTAVDWELYEASIVSVPADNAAVIRSLDSDRALPAVLQSSHIETNFRDLVERINALESNSKSEARRAARARMAARQAIASR
jgi:hypothetical protein